MDSNKTAGGKNEMDIEDYGSPASEDKQSGDMSDTGGRYSGGTEGTKGSGEGERFGEFENTGKGVDLTVEMENSDARTGMVKGGEEGADSAAGPGQYGGRAGGLAGSSNN